ncbi:hypothetical protein [Paenibacillus sp. MER TA 81-3]|nr:hypothetical protein [Paenibacillus sp. MER TA 81-3]
MKPIGQGRTADIFEYQKDKIMKLYHQGFPGIMLVKDRLRALS